MSNNIYSSKFVSAVRNILTIACADGARMTREELSECLETDGYNASPDFLKVAIEEGAFNTPKQAWALFTGRFGGIRELDLEATAQVQKALEERQDKINARIQKRLATLAARKISEQSSSVQQLSEQQVSI